MNLVIVESPTKAKKLSQYLGEDFVVEASRGHVRDLPKSKIGVDVEKDFAPTYESIKGSAAIIKKLAGLAKKADHLYLATDPDREGEAISWHLLEAWDNKKLHDKAERAVFHEITKDAVLEAIAHPKKLNLDLVDAQQARRVLDRLVGYKLSPVLWKKVRRGLSAGRVQSVALRLIVERELEIEAFVPEEYWEVDVDLETKKGNFLARVFELAAKPYEPHSQKDVDQVSAFAKEAAYTVDEVERKQRSRRAFAPFTTSTLQQAAANRLGYSAKRTMQLAQQLYEEGFITYHRTDSTALSGQALNLARGYISREFGAKYLPEKPNFFATKSKNAQEAHEAVRPTADNPRLELTGKLTSTHAKLYDLIFRRFVASQMNPAVYDQTTITVTGEKGAHRLRARSTGSVILFDGWMKLFPGGEDVILPEVEAKETLKFRDLLTAQKFTQPPPRYNDASLVKELEKRGIGRPSTYASIISVIIDRGYVERNNKAFIPTPVGRTVDTFLVKNFPEVLDYDFTAHMEDDLDEIALGNKKWTKVLSEFYGPFAKKLAQVEKTAERAPIPMEPLGKTCPKCGLPPEEFAQLTQEGKTLATMPAAEAGAFKPREHEHGELIIRSGRFGKFISCTRYPDCDYTDKYLETINMVCPKCGKGEVVIKRTKKGRNFYGCSLYPECDFASWSKPGAKKGKKGDEAAEEE